MKNSSTTIEQLRRDFSLANSPEELCATLRAVLQQFLGPDIIKIHCSLAFDGISNAYLGASYLPLEFVDNRAHFEGNEISECVFASKSLSLPDSLALQLLGSSGYKSVALIPVYLEDSRAMILEVAYTSSNFRWKFDSRLFLERAVEYFGLHLSRILGRSSSEQFHAGFSEDRSSLGEWMAQAPNMVTVETNDAFTVTAMVGNSEKLLGLSKEQIIGDAGFWARVMHPSDAKKLLLKTQRGEPKDLEDEFRFVNQKTAKIQALLISARPRLASNGRLLGWTGFALDVTDRYQARRELLLERSRLQALYKVARAQQTSSNGSVVALKTLQVLLSATQADSGFVMMFNATRDEVEVVASAGFNLQELEALERSPEFKQLLEEENYEQRVTVKDGADESKLLRLIFSDETPLWRIAQINLRFEASQLGTMFVCTRKPKFFSAADLDLLDVAASQVALSTRQAELFVAEKEQASSLAALYRLSHGLSQQLTAQDVIEHAMPIIKEELACKRIWLGVVNEQQTLLVGQSGIGPGMRDGVSTMTIDLTVSHPFLDTAIRTRQSVVVPSGANNVCPDLNKLFERLEIGAFAVVPLIALGQVVGVIAVEPLASNSFFGEKKRQLLDSMASEIATIILARRYESRVADSAKMRMAALLSSGVAHNFNNLLQAIMGQASLIELDSLNQEQRARIASMIMDSAAKGSNLVKQLYSFSSEATFSPEFISLKTLLFDLKERFATQLGDKIELQYQVADDSLEIKGDTSMMQQVFTNLVENAKEALSKVAEPKVKVTANRLRIRSGEIHADLSPGSYVTISVEDNGAGMSEDEVARCFEPFYSTKNVDPRTGLSFSGAGLGLSSAYLIVRQHEGVIVASSKKGQGATFTVYLPVVTLKSRDSKKNSDQPASVVGEKQGELKSAK